MGVMVKDKSESMLRWLVLLLTCTLMIGNYYCYDIPAALHAQMDEYMGKPDDFETLFSLLYTVYSVPNVILPFFGGYFVDKFGVRVCMITFAVFITIGQLVFAFGLSLKSWPIMFVGRVIYGFGGESMGVANSAMLSVWFKGKEMAFAFGLNLSVARLGSVINNLVSPVLASSIDIQFALWFGVILCGGSIMSAVGLASCDSYMDAQLATGGAHMLLPGTDDENDVLAIAKGENSRNSTEVRNVLTKGLIANDNESANVKTGEEEGEEDTTEPLRHASTDHQVPIDTKEVTFKDVLTYKPVYWLLTLICVVVYGCVLPFNNIASTLLLERDYFMAPPDSCQLQSPQYCESSLNPPVDCPASKYYQPPLPLNATIDGTVYNPLTTSDIDCTESSWSSGCLSEYCSRLDAGEKQAATIMSIPYIISACLSPVLGGFVDKFGMRAFISTLAPAVLIGVHLMLGITDVDPVGPLVGQGLAYSGFAAVVWPSVALVVEPRLVGLGYGIAFSIQNLGLALFPVIIASLYESNGSKYIPTVEYFFTALAVIGTMIGIFLCYYDYFYLDSVLNRASPPSQEEEGEDRSSQDGRNSNRNNIARRSRTSTDSKRQNFNEKIVRAYDGDEGEEEEEEYDEEEEQRRAREGRHSSSETFASAMLH